MSKIEGFIDRRLNMGVFDSDPDQVKLQKQLLNVLGVTVPLASLWAFFYIVFDEIISGMIMFGYTLGGLVAFFVYMKNPSRYVYAFLQLRVQVFVIPIILAFSLGDIYHSSFFVVWSLTAPLTSLFVNDGRGSIKWYFAFVIAVIVHSFFPVRLTNNLPESFIVFFSALNLLGMSIPTYFTAQYAISQRTRISRLLEKEKDRTEELLLNVLPAEVVSRLHDEETYVEEFEDVSVLFADIVGFTKLTEQIGARAMLDTLNEIFTYFDSLLYEFSAEKIRTIGDNYMVAVGTPTKQSDHAYLLVSMGKKMLEYLQREDIKSKGIDFRIGINSGSVVAGVIGKHKFHFDIWGDMVNTASRLESHGIPGRIQIGKATYEFVKDRIDCKSRGAIDIKGKGRLETWLVS